MAPFAPVVLAVFVAWLLVGVVASVRSQVARAGRSGESRALAVVVGAVLAFPVEWSVLVAVGLVAVWSAL